MTQSIDKNLQARMFRFTHMRRDDECWNWKGPTNVRGYPKLNYKGKPYGAHRVVYESFYKKPEKHYRVDQICGNKLCMNPRHLTKGMRCPNGHYYTHGNTQLVGKYKARRCKRCHADYIKRWRRSRNETNSGEVKKA